MAISDSVAYEALALELQRAGGDISDDAFVSGLAAIVDDVETKDDLFGLLLRLNALAGEALIVACAAAERDPREVLRLVALEYAAAAVDSDGADDSDA